MQTADRLRTLIFSSPTHLDDDAHISCLESLSDSTLHYYTLHIHNEYSVSPVLLFIHVNEVLVLHWYNEFKRKKEKRNKEKESNV